MNRLLAILLTLFALLPHPALLAGVSVNAAGGPCEGEEVCPSLCACCGEGACECVQKKDAPVAPVTPAPVVPGDLYPVPAEPPAETTVARIVMPVAKAGEATQSIEESARLIPHLPLHVRLCVFLN